MPATFTVTPELLFSWAIPEPNSGCWIWTRSLCNAGYAKVWHQKRYWVAHRLAFEFARGPIPPGLELDHLCRVRCCINPDHLEPVTHLENVRRGRRWG